MIFRREGNWVHIWSAEPDEDQDHDYVGSVPVAPGETPDSDELLRRLGVRSAFFEYDFADDAGAVGVLYISDYIPSGVFVVGGSYKVQTTFTTATTGTIALGIEAAGDLVAANDPGGGASVWDAATPVNIPAGTKDALATTARRRVRLDIATDAVTAGKLVGHITYSFVSAIAASAT